MSPVSVTISTNPSPSGSSSTTSGTSATPSPPVSPDPDADYSNEEADDPGVSSYYPAYSPRPSRPHLRIGRTASHRKRARGIRSGRAGRQHNRGGSERVSATNGVEWRWKQGNNFIPKTLHFDEHRSGITTRDVNRNSREVDFFKLFFTLDIITTIVQQCNLHHAFTLGGRWTLPHSRHLQWVDVTVDEFYTFLSMVLLMGIMKKETIRDYWSTDIMIQTPIFQNLLSSNRFSSIMHSLHFSDNIFWNTVLDTDSMRKIRLVFDHLRAKFSSVFGPYQKVCIDESLVQWRGKIRFRQYIPSKRHRFGLKLFVMCDCKTGYIIDMILYTTDTTELRYDRSSGLPAAVVKTLMDPLLGNGHVLYCDNWYTSPALFKFLLDNNTGACGTCKRNGRGMPRLPSKREMQQNEVRNIEAQGCLITSWRDKRDVHIMSTVHDPIMEQSRKQDPITKEFKWKPQAVIDYNINMRLVDKSDSMISSVNCARKSMRWYKKLFFHLLDMTMLNAHILHGQVTGKNIKLGKFIREVARQLIATHHPVPRRSCSRSPSDTRGRATPQPSPDQPASRHPSPARRTQDVEQNPERILSNGHFVTRLPGNISGRQSQRRCYVCSNTTRRPPCRRDTIYKCETCDVPLCLLECFKDYHTLLHF